ncbi:MAG: RidA family protein [Gemmatimonadaceae bacterium]|nr:RidA family protein [Gemmatimonadaceae bacterium]
MTVRYVSTPDAPAPAGHYSQATVHQGVVYVAGMLPLDPATRELVPGGLEAQLERTLRNIEAVLVAAGSDWAHALRLTVYVPDMALWGAVNATYARVLGDARPARAVIPTRELKPGVLCEIDCIAAVRA